MILVSGIKIRLGEPEAAAEAAAIRKLGVSGRQVLKAYVSKVSLDARKQKEIFKVCTVHVFLNGGEEQLVKRLGLPFVSYREEKPLEIKIGTKPLGGPVVIAGFGPAGIFAADLLARYGYHPLVLERGGRVDERVKAVEGFWQRGVLDDNCNVQFGEGGAGTFSDGKLTTRINDPLCGYVLERFRENGAPEETLKKAKPHIGTDRLREVVSSMREGILRNGGRILFRTALEDIDVRDGRLAGIRAGGESFSAGALILSIGHSARDTFRMLGERGLFMEPKAFSVGARIEHRQKLIDEGLYGALAGHPDLPPGEYQLSYRTDERGVYTFCMCPGGTVVPAASGRGQVVTNGMSEYKRDKDNANAAVAVSVGPADFGTGVFDGVRFQEALEQRAFALSGGSYKGCGVTVGNFLAGKKGLSLGRVEPSYALGLEAVDFDRLFPSFVTDWMRRGLGVFDRKLRGFASPDAVLTGPETRTSSPVRITRGEDLQSLTAKGIYPCGEGAGYAGGIMSAAVDGVRVALRIMAEYKPE